MVYRSIGWKYRDECPSPVCCLLIPLVNDTETSLREDVDSSLRILSSDDPLDYVRRSCAKLAGDGIRSLCRQRTASCKSLLRVLFDLGFPIIRLLVLGKAYLDLFSFLISKRAGAWFPRVIILPTYEAGSGNKAGAL